MKRNNYRLFVLMVLGISSLILLIGCNKSNDDGLELKETEVSMTETSVTTVQEASTDDQEKTDFNDEVNESDNEKELPHFDESGVWYEIFVRGFADGDGDGIGDFVGLTNQLDYLNDGDDSTDDDLSVDGIWLMPISPSPSYHGYDVTDYYGINPDYGTMDDFKVFLAEAHDRGIKVIIDLVLNHSSAEHPWFKDALANENSPYRDYYQFQSEDNENFNFNKQVWGHDVWIPTGDDYYYAIFWDQMPDLNYMSIEVREEMIDVAKFWLELGVDGFRVDAISHIFGSGELEEGVEYAPLIDAWWQEFNSALRVVKPDYYLVGEAWEPIKDRAEYAKYFDTTFDFDIADTGILGMVKKGYEFDDKENGLNTKITEIQNRLDEASTDFINGVFLTNHDMRRAMDYLDGDVKDMKLASLMYMTLPGNPFIYYGEEIGMLGGKPDEIIREPFIWGDRNQTSWKELEANTDTMSVLMQERVPDSLLNHYREIIRLRKDNTALLEGTFTGVDTESMKVVAYVRESENQKLLVIHNVSSEYQDVSWDELSIDSQTELMYSHPMNPEGDDAQLSVPGKTTLIYVIE